MNKTKLVLASIIVTAIGYVHAYTLDTDAKRIGYTIGADIGSTLGEFTGEENELDFNALIVGLKDAYEGNDLSMTIEEMDETMQVFAQKRAQEMQEEQAKLMEEQKKQQAENLKAGQKFLEDNAQKEGVKTTDSGLQYLVLKEGKGEKPGPQASVTVHYEGSLIDGTVFDSSIERGEPVSFNINQVIDGWVEGLQLMSEGAKYRFFIPAGLAYGEAGVGLSIPPNSTLIFDIELIKVDTSDPDKGVEKPEQAKKAEETEDTADTRTTTAIISSKAAEAQAEDTIAEAKANAEAANQEAKDIAADVLQEADDAKTDVTAEKQDNQSDNTTADKASELANEAVKQEANEAAAVSKATK